MKEYESAREENRKKGKVRVRMYKLEQIVITSL